MRKIPLTLLCYPCSHLGTCKTCTNRNAYLLVLYVSCAVLICAFSIQVGIISAPFSSLLENPPCSFQTFRSTERHNKFYFVVIILSHIYRPHHLAQINHSKLTVGGYSELQNRPTAARQNEIRPKSYLLAKKVPSRSFSFSNYKLNKDMKIL